MEGAGLSPTPERVTSGQQWKDTLVNAFESQGKRPDIVEPFTQAGYLWFDRAGVVRSPEYSRVVDTQHAIIDIPIGVQAVRSLMDRERELLAKEFKVHVQPQKEYIPFFVAQIAKFWQGEGRGLFDTFKVHMNPGNNDSRGNVLPEIVIYANLGRENAMALVDGLKKNLASFDHLGNGLTPRFNTKISESIFLAQSGGDLKNELARLGLLDDYFDKSTGYAFMQGEAARWAGIAQGGQSENPLAINQNILRVAQAMKRQEPTPLTPEVVDTITVIQQRIRNGENLQQIIEKSAANVRELSGQAIEQPVTIGGAKSFDELNQAIDKLGGLQGSKDYFTAEELKQFIEEVRRGNRDLQYITRTGDLRMKVEELLRGRK